jgi:hypothetical protein
MAQFSTSEVDCFSGTWLTDEPRGIRRRRPAG